MLFVPIFQTRKTKQQKTIFAFGVTMSLAEWIIDGTCLVFFRILFGPLPSWICQVRLFITLTAGFFNIFVMNDLFFVSYLYICVWKTVGRINEEFVQHLATVMNLSMAFLMSFVLIYSGQGLSIYDYKICRISIDDKDDVVCSVFGDETHLFQLIFMSSGLICICLLVRILIQIYQENKNNYAGQTIPMGSLEIVKIARVHMIVLIITAIPNTIAFKWRTDNIGSDDITYKTVLLIAFFATPIAKSFIFPILSIFSRDSLSSKFKKLFRKQDMVHPVQ